MNPTAPLTLDAELAAFIAGPVAIGLSACGADGRPRLVRGAGCWVTPDRQRVCVFVPITAGESCLAAAQGRDAVAAVFCLPGPERAVQIKGDQVRIESPAAWDRQVAAARAEAWADNLTTLGYRPGFARAVHSWPVDSLRVLSFRPRECYDQTPGPRAGTTLGGAAP